MKAKRLFPLAILLLAALVFTAVTAGALPNPAVPPNAPQAPAQEQPPDGDPTGSSVPNVVTACTTPTTANIRDKSVTFDQCYEHTFTYANTNYTVHLFYTEQDSAANLSQCSAAEKAGGRCEHKLDDNDDQDGNNVNIVAMAQESEATIKFYKDRKLNHISGTTLNVYVAEDPRGGGVIWPDSIYVDDEAMNNIDNKLRKRELSYHENMHLVQDKYDNLSGWQTFFGEGIARAIEDRVDTELDAASGDGLYFIPEVNGFLGDNDNRTADILDITYRSVLWWTWLFDQYRAPGDTEPVLGWNAILGFYDELKTENSQLKAVEDFIIGQKGKFRKDFIDYTLALYAYKFNPTDPRLGYVDAEIKSKGKNLSGHNVISGGPAMTTVSKTMNPRSSRYWEFNPANQCDFISYRFDGKGKEYGFSVMTVKNGKLQDRWTSYSKEWARTVSSSDLERVVGVVTSDANSGSVDVSYGCVKTTLNIKDPNSNNEEMVGNADNPRSFIVRIDVDGEDGKGIPGLTAASFKVQLRQTGGGALLDAAIINSLYVQDDYWLLVEPPTNGAGAQTGMFYDLIVTMGSESDTENSAILYIARNQDVVVVLDRSGSMLTANKIQAARNAATLLVNELADTDQGAYVTFSSAASLDEQLDQMNSGSQRQDLLSKIALTNPSGPTSIGDGMQTAAAEEDARGKSTNKCSFVLLSDGYENVAPFWADVADGVANNGCAIHSIGLGPEANEVLMQNIAATVSGGSYDYADSSGTVPITNQAPNSFALDSTTADGVSWENNLSRVYDYKAIQMAGRQRLGSGYHPGSYYSDDYQYYQVFVDETTTELVASVGWQKEEILESASTATIQLYDPDDNLVTPSSHIKSGTNEVLRVNNPKTGTWTLFVAGVYQEYVASASAVTDYQLRLFIGTPVESLSQGVQVPILATFIGPGKPLTGAKVVAIVHDPDGTNREIMLYDDGSHGDMEANDGVYGNWYTATSKADADVPQAPIDGQEPAKIGSYQVSVTAETVQGDTIYREAQGSFAIQKGSDTNNNGLPDDWEKKHGVTDPDGDPDMDGIKTKIELERGTNPVNSDSDGGGESDGSEVPDGDPTKATGDPLEPADDRVGPLTSVKAHADLLQGLPIIVIEWGPPKTGTLQHVNIYRRLVENGQAGPWQSIATNVPGNTDVDKNVTVGKGHQYLIEPAIMVPNGGTIVIGGLVESNVVVPSTDPYPPGGKILINNDDKTTSSLAVELEVTADDFFGSSDGAPAVPVPGSPVEKLQMRLSNSPDFGNTPWQPYQHIVSGWRLTGVQTGETATVYVEFRDEAGNISKAGIGTSDSIVYTGTESEKLYLYLPVVRIP